MEQPSASSSISTSTSTSTTTTIPKKSRWATKPIAEEDDAMRLDDTKHKVYIYDLDAELSSDSEASDDGRLVFLPDIKKHLRESRIPPIVLANSDGELAGMNQQMVLYNIPSSLTVPEEQDSVRKAIIESRARSRAKLEERKNRESQSLRNEDSSKRVALQSPTISNAGWVNGTESWNTFGVPPVESGSVRDVPVAAQTIEEYDPDAMDLG